MHEHIAAQLLSAKPLCTERGNTALHQAAKQGLEEAVAQLLAVCPFLIDEEALHVAAYQGHTAIVAQLLAVKPTLIEAVTREGETALHFAAEGHPPVVAQLLAVNPALSEAVTRKGETARD